MNRVYIEENGVYQIDLRAALWSMENLHFVYESIGNMLSDVDFIAETDDAMLVIEYKNTEVEKAQRKKAKDAFIDKADSGKLADSIVKKYYGSTFYLLACGRRKPVRFIFILETTLIDSVSKKLLYDSVWSRLPFKLQKNYPEIGQLITGFEILSVTEWNEKYPEFPLEKC